MRLAEIALELSRARRSAGLTQAELARRMGTTQSAISRAEAGWSMPSLDFLERFVGATGQPLRLGSLAIGPAPAAELDFSLGDDARRARIRRALGEFEFNPWLRDPTEVEQRSLLADGLTHERFESPKPA